MSYILSKSTLSGTGSSTNSSASLNAPLTIGDRNGGNTSSHVTPVQYSPVSPNQKLDSLTLTSQRQQPVSSAYLGGGSTQSRNASTAHKNHDLALLDLLPEEQMASSKPFLAFGEETEAANKHMPPGLNGERMEQPRSNSTALRTSSLHSGNVLAQQAKAKTAELYRYFLVLPKTRQTLQDYIASVFEKAGLEDLDKKQSSQQAMTSNSNSSTQGVSPSSSEGKPDGKQSSSAGKVALKEDAIDDDQDVAGPHEDVPASGLLMMGELTPGEQQTTEKKKVSVVQPVDEFMLFESRPNTNDESLTSGKSVSTSNSALLDRGGRIRPIKTLPLEKGHEETNIVISTEEPREEAPKSPGVDANGKTLSPRHPSNHLNRNRTTFSPAKSPRELKLTPPTHLVDELDAAHRRGGLSPRAVSPQALLSTEVNHSNRAISPMEMNITPSQQDFVSPDKHRPSKHTGLLPFDRTTSEPGSRRTSRSNSPVGSVSEMPPSTKPLGNEDSTSALISTPHIFPVATVRDIPTFYFGWGKPNQGGNIVLDEMLIYPNAPPQLPPSVQQAQRDMIIKQQKAALAANGGVAMFDNGMRLGGLPNFDPQPIVIPAMSAMPAKQAYSFLAQQWDSIPPTHGGSCNSSTNFPPGSRKGLRSSSSNRQKSGSIGGLAGVNASSANREVLYWQQVNAMFHRIATQCFGLPGYFSKLLLQGVMALQAHMSATPPSSPTAPVFPTSTSASNPFGGRYPTVQAVKDFYNAYLDDVSIVRRMFNVLIASSKKDPFGTTTSGENSTQGKDIFPSLRNFLLREDFQLFLDILLELHPGLAFLRQSSDFQTKYLETVVYRIFFDIDLYDKNKISFPDFQRSKLPDAIRQVDHMDDINSVLNYFSYEHFYVLYCRFWELDEDRDMLLRMMDLERYLPENCMNPRIIERVFAGHGRKLSNKTTMTSPAVLTKSGTASFASKKQAFQQQQPLMNYEDFVWFCLAEEDKTHPRAIRYWFRILDVDGDGILSGYELEEFYEFTRLKMVQMTTECIQFHDVMCQIRDMLPLASDKGIFLSDLLRYPQPAHVAINMLINVVKFLQFEQRDPFVAHQDRLAGGLEKTEWDRFARAEYDRMAMEAEAGGEDA